MESFNLLVSCSWGAHGRAKAKIRKVLRALGDETPLVKRTVARGVIGVRTSLDPRRVVNALRALWDQDPLLLQDTRKWVPVDLWTSAEIDRMREAVVGLREIGESERWRMTVEKRRYTRHHTSEIIAALAESIDREVDLTNPDKILRIDVIGGDAAISVLRPEEAPLLVPLAPGKPPLRDDDDPC